LKQKDIYKSRFDELKSQKNATEKKTNKTYNVESKLTAHSQQNQNTSSVPGFMRGTAAAANKERPGMSFKDR